MGRRKSYRRKSGRRKSDRRKSGRRRKSRMKRNVNVRSKKKQMRGGVDPLTVAAVAGAAGYGAYKGYKYRKWVNDQNSQKRLQEAYGRWKSPKRKSQINRMDRINRMHEGISLEDFWREKVRHVSSSEACAKLNSLLAAGDLNEKEKATILKIMAERGCEEVDDPMADTSADKRNDDPTVE